jgi:hypothetical protein
VNLRALFERLKQAVDANIGLLALFVAILSLWVTLLSAQRARDQLALAHPARLKVHNISMLPKAKIWKAPLLEPGRILEAIVQVTNPNPTI